MTEYNFENFNLYCFKDFTDSDSRRKSTKFMQRDDLIVSLSKENFIQDLRNIPIEKVDYISYWKELVKRSIINVYDELIESREEIEEEIKELDCDVFIIRKNKDE